MFPKGVMKSSRDVHIMHNTLPTGATESCPILSCFVALHTGKGREVVCGQVWWPILRICPLHLTHPSAHSQQWTHTWSSGQPYCGARGAVGGSVPCSRVSPQSWYWRWREHLLFTPPTDNPCRTWESNRQPLGYKSNSLTIRPRAMCTGSTAFF